MKQAFRIAAGLACALLIGTAGAQGYPAKPVTIIIPFAAGGPTDIVGRQLAQAMTKPMGGTVIVDNKPARAVRWLPNTSNRQRRTATPCCCITLAWRPRLPCIASCASTR